MLKINLQNINYFLKVAETLNFTAAARELYVSQPALSKQIRLLEEEVGIRLLKRDTKGVELTEGGRIMYRTWSDVIERTEEALEEARRANLAHREKIRIGLLEMGGLIDLISPLLECFAEERKDVELEISTYGFVQLKEKLKKHELDMILTFSSEIPLHRSDIPFRILMEMDLNIIVPRKNHLYSRENLNIQDLKNEVLCVFSSTYSEEAKRSILEHYKKAGVRPAGIKTFPNVTSLEVGLSAIGGVTMGYRVFFSNMKEKLKFFPLADEIDKHYIVAAWDEQKDVEIKEIVDNLSENLQGR